MHGPARKKKEDEKLGPQKAFPIGRTKEKIIISSSIINYLDLRPQANVENQVGGTAIIVNVSLQLWHKMNI